MTEQAGAKDEVMSSHKARVKSRRAKTVGSKKIRGRKVRRRK